MIISLPFIVSKYIVSSSQFLQFSIIFYFHPICYIPHFPSPSQSLFLTPFLLVTGDSLFPPLTTRLFLHHFHPPQFLLHCLFFNTHTHTQHHNTVSSPEFSISSSNVLEDFPTGVCFRLFKHSIIYTHLPPSLLRQPTNTHPFCHLDVSIRACARSASPVPPVILTLGPLDRIFQTWLESSSYLRRLRSNFLERMWWKDDIHEARFLIKLYTSSNRRKIKNNLTEREEIIYWKLKISFLYCIYFWEIIIFKKEDRKRE